MLQVPLPGIELIKTFEGCRLEAYPDPLSGGKPYTIGWGSTRRQDGRPFQLGERISQQEADELLVAQLADTYLPPQQRIPGWASMGDAQRGAVLSFAYNLGAHFYGSSGFETISRVLREQAWAQLESAFTLYRNPGSSVEEGLLRRRLTEADVFLQGTPGFGLSKAAQHYLRGGRTYHQSSHLSQEARRYLGGGDSPPAHGTKLPQGQRTLYLATPLMEGDDVLAVQKALRQKGAGIVMDGSYGPATAEAVKRFQLVNGLTADGVVGPQTWSQLQQRVLYLADPPMRGEDVQQLQQGLRRWGFELIADGVLGAETDSALRRFQQARGLTADGVLGPQTRASLGLS